MSLELALQENTAAVNALRALLEKGFTPTPAADQVDAPAETTKASTKRETKKAEAPKVEEPATETKAAEPATRDQAGKALTTLANKKGRDAAMNVLTNVGAKTLGEVKPDDYAAVITACELALA